MRRFSVSCTKWNSTFVVSWLPSRTSRSVIAAESKRVSGKSNSMSIWRSLFSSPDVAIVTLKGLGGVGGTYSSPAFSALSLSFSCFSRSFCSSLVSFLTQAKRSLSVDSTRLFIESCLKNVIVPFMVSGSSSAGRSNHSATVSFPAVCGSYITLSEGSESNSNFTTSGFCAPKYRRALWRFTLSCPLSDWRAKRLSMNIRKYS